MGGWEGAASNAGATQASGVPREGFCRKERKDRKEEAGGGGK